MRYELEGGNNFIKMPYNDFINLYGKVEYREIYKWDRVKYSYVGEEMLISSWFPLAPIEIQYEHFNFTFAVTMRSANRD